MLVDKQHFIDNYSAGKLNDVAANTIGHIIDFYNEDDGFTCARQLAYILATAYHESAHTWNPSIREYGKGAGRKYSVPVNGQVYYGRGLCQLTWHFNYKKFSELLGIDLVNVPELALSSEYSVKILMIGMRDGIFTGKKLTDYFDEVKTDWVNARKIVNGNDKADMIAGYAKAFNNNLKEI